MGEVKKLKKGNRLVFMIIGIVILAEFILLFYLNYLYTTRGLVYFTFNKSLLVIGRFVFYGILLFYLYKGKIWAKNIMIVTYSVNALLTSVYYIEYKMLFMMFISIITMLLSVLVILVFSSSINEYMQYKNGDHQPMELKNQNSQKSTCNNF